MIVTATLQAELVTIPDVVNVAPQTIVALPPSEADDDGGGFGAYADQYAGTTPTGTAGDMRVYANGSLILRAYDRSVES